MEQVSLNCDGVNKSGVAPESVSVIVEQDTRRFLDRIPFETTLKSVTTSTNRIVDRPVEVLLVGGELPAGLQLPDRVRHVTVDRGGYYAAKNAGARQAQFDLMVFWDSDCRPKEDYLSVALEVLDANPQLIGVTGVTQYDGNRWLTRLNTLLSFGYLREPADNPRSSAALAHNLVIRRTKLAEPNSPFGPHCGRSGGDIHLTRSAEAAGQPLRLMQELVVSHEDPSFSIFALLERHLREHFNPLIDRGGLSQFDVARTVVLRVLGSFSRRRSKLYQFDRFLPQPVGRPTLASAILLLYLLLDLTVVVALVGCRPLLNRWLAYQFGRDLTSWPQQSLS